MYFQTYLRFLNEWGMYHSLAPSSPECACIFSFQGYNWEGITSWLQDWKRYGFVPDIPGNILPQKLKNVLCESWPDSYLQPGLDWGREREESPTSAQLQWRSSFYPKGLLSREGKRKDPPHIPHCFVFLLVSSVLYVFWRLVIIFPRRNSKNLRVYVLPRERPLLHRLPHRGFLPSVKYHWRSCPFSTLVQNHIF